MHDQIKVLVVDDDRDAVETLVDILSEKGYQVSSAYSFEEALSQAQRDRFDVVLVDVRLNDVVGTDLLAHFNRLNPDAAGIVMTAFGSVYTSMKAIEYGATAYMLKPLDIHKLVATIDKAVETKRLAADNRRMLHQLAAINSVAVAVNQSLDLKSIVEHTVKHVHAALEPDDAWIFLVDSARHALVLKSHIGLDDVAQDLIHAPIRVGEDLIGRVAEAGHPIIISERAHQDPRATRPHWRRIHCNAFAAVPILAKEHVLGVLGAATRGDNKRTFSIHDTQLLEGIAGQVGLAIENARIYDEMQRLAMIDELTGLSNRRHFFNSLEREIARAKRKGDAFGLIMFDLDNFKSFNDRFGHLAGDEALQHIARAARRAVRRMDLIGRYGGEEFVILLPESNREGTVEVAERLRAEAAAVDGLPQGERLTVSAGVAVFPIHGREVDQLVRAADEALYQAKRAGKNRVVLAGETHLPHPALHLQTHR